MKMKYNISILLLSLFCMLAASCQKDMDDTALPEGCGGLNLRTVAVEDSSEITIIRTKSFDMDVTTFQVEIINLITGETVKKYTSYQEMLDGERPMVVLPVGSYKVYIYSCEPENGVYDKPYFMAEQNFEIEDKTVTTVDKLVCKFSNVGVDIRMSDNFNYLFSDNYSIIVENGQNGKVTYTRENKGQIIYFDRIGESIKLTVTVQPKNAGEPYPTRTYYVKNGNGNPSIGEYYIITFDGEKPAVKVSF